MDASQGRTTPSYTFARSDASIADGGHRS